MTRLALMIAFLAGLTLLAVLAARQGMAEVAAVVASAGWGLVAIVGVHLLQVCFSALAWRAAIRPARELSVATTMFLRWIREAVNGLLPVAQIGGEVIGARLLAKRGVPANIATASVVADITYEVVSQLVFTVMGGLLYYLSGYHSDFDGAMALGVFIMVPVLAVFVIVQRHGMFEYVERFLNWLAARLPVNGIGSMEGLHGSLQRLYADRRAIAAGLSWHLTSWAAGAIEIWLILYCIGKPVSLGDAFILESLGQAIRTAAFLVPGAVGVQEGGFMILGPLFGLSPEVGLGLSLAKRVRELALGIPGILAWQFLEGHLWLQRRAATALTRESGD